MILRKSLFTTHALKTSNNNHNQITTTYFPPILPCPVSDVWPVRPHWNPGRSRHGRPKTKPGMWEAQKPRKLQTTVGGPLRKPLVRPKVWTNHANKSSQPWNNRWTTGKSLNHQQKKDLKQLNLIALLTTTIKIATPSKNQPLQATNQSPGSQLRATCRMCRRTKERVGKLGAPMPASGDRGWAGWRLGFCGWWKLKSQQGSCPSQKEMKSTWKHQAVVYKRICH